MDGKISVPKIVLIESPYRGDSYKKTFKNIIYARLCVRDSLIERGEIPFASHLFLTQTGITYDSIDDERRAGIEAGWEIGKLAYLSAFYIDLGWSSGMIGGKAAAEEAGRKIEERSLGNPEKVASMIERLANVRSSVNEGIHF